MVVDSNSVLFEFVIHIKKSSDKLLVLGSGSIPPEDKEKFLNRPVFNRILWPFKQSTIYYNDPTRNIPGVDLLGGWGLGTQDNWYLLEISKIIQIIAEKIYNYSNDDLKYNNLIFYGSSMGGFMSLQLATLVKNSIALAEMPQFELCSWDYWPVLKEQLFPNLSLGEIINNFSYKLNIYNLILREKYIPNAYLILDCSVDFDFQNQYKNFFDNLNNLPFVENNDINKIKIRIDGKNIGHEQVDYIELYKVIDKVCLIMDYSNKNHDFLISKYFEYERISLEQKSDLLKYIIGRLDLKNYGVNNSIELLGSSDKELHISRPEWFNTVEGEGLVLESSKGSLDLEFKCINEGLLRLFLRGIYYLNKTSNKIMPIYINFNYLTINDVEIVNGDNIVWHNNPFVYEQNVHDGEIIKLHIEWRPG